MFPSCYKTLSDHRRNNSINYHCEIRVIFILEPKQSKYIPLVVSLLKINIDIHYIMNEWFINKVVYFPF